MRIIPLLLIPFFGLFTSKAIAQAYSLEPVQKSGPFTTGYKKAIGVKMYPSAISYKSFMTDSKALEVLGYFTLDGFRSTVMMEKYNAFANNEQLSWYIGYGGHLGIWSEEWKKNNPTHKAGIALGVDGILGLDYKIKNAPLNLSIDWQPSFNFVGSSYFESGWAGLGIRYTLK
ncbi:MAG: hypothetical protein WCG90_04455 [Chitinophagia bacterium]